MQRCLKRSQLTHVSAFLRNKSIKYSLFCECETGFEYHIGPNRNFPILVFVKTWAKNTMVMKSHATGVIEWKEGQEGPGILVRREWGKRSVKEILHSPETHIAELHGPCQSTWMNQTTATIQITATATTAATAQVLRPQSRKELFGKACVLILYFPYIWKLLCKRIGTRQSLYIFPLSLHHTGT